MNLVASKTREFKRTLYSESFKLKTVVRAFFRREGSRVREEIIADEQSSAEILKPDEFMYRPNAPNIRRKAICDEIEKCILQSGVGSLRSLRSDLIVAANLKTWQLIQRHASCESLLIKEKPRQPSVTAIVLTSELSGVIFAVALKTFKSAPTSECGG